MWGRWKFFFVYECILIIKVSLDRDLGYIFISFFIYLFVFAVVSCKIIWDLYNNVFVYFKEPEAFNILYLVSHITRQIFIIVYYMKNMVKMFLKVDSTWQLMLYFNSISWDTTFAWLWMKVNPPSMIGREEGSSCFNVCYSVIIR